MNLLIGNNMAHHHHQHSTKSIDVGGVFFMDLSVNDADFNDDLNEDNSSHTRGSPADTRRHLNSYHQDKSIRLSPTYQSMNAHDSSMRRNQAKSIVDHHQHRSKTTKTTTTSMKTTSKATTQPPPPFNDYLGSSLDKLASVINCDGQEENGLATGAPAPAPPPPQQPPISRDDNESSLTIVRQQQASQQQQPYDFKELQSSCSLSDESYVATSGEASLSASLAGSSERDFEDKGSTTTREDSGVLDMKDLEGQLNNNGSYEADYDYRSFAKSSTTNNRPLEQEKSILNDIMAANLINNSAIGKFNLQYQQQENNINYNRQQQQQQLQQQQNRSIYKPTDGSSNTNHYHNNSRSNHSKRSVSASLPIQVPTTRQMKRNLNRMKLNLMRDEEPPAAIESVATAVATAAAAKAAADETAENSPVRKGDRNRPAIENLVAFDDDDAFLNQEFNANHHNHYPIDELDREHLTAEDDPMRLFASIQALAKSLHEDAELFGSLPPKRMLESPIRSIALV